MNQGTGGYNGEQMTDYDEEMDWENVGNPPPAHRFNLLCTKAEHTLSKSSNKHMIKTVFEIEGYDPANQDEKFIGRSLFCNLNFTQQGGFLTKQFFQVAGLDLPRVINKAILEEVCASILNVRIGAQLKHRTFQDQTQADVSKFMELLDVGNQIAAEGEEPGVVDNTAGDEEQEALDAAPPEETEEVEEAAPPQPSMRRSLRESVPQTPPKATAAAARPKLNGQANGHTNGAAAASRRPAAAPAPTPAKKAVAKPTARR